MYPVVDNGRLVGRITTSTVASVPREEWSRRSVGDVAERPDTHNTADVHDDPMDALDTMNATGVSRLMVLEDGRLVGVVTRQDLLSFLSLKIEFEESMEQTKRQHT